MNESNNIFISTTETQYSSEITNNSVSILNKNIPQFNNSEPALNNNIPPLNNSNLYTFDISNVENDFIYKMIEYYLEQVTKEPSMNLIDSINNMVDTIMSYYLLAKRNGVINVTNARKMLALKLGKDPFEMNEDLLDQYQNLNEEFEKLESYLVDLSEKPVQQMEDNNEEVAKIDELINNHQDFITEMERKKMDIKNNINKTNQINEEQDNVNYDAVDKITYLEKKLNADIESIEESLKESKKNFMENKNEKQDIISQSDIDIMVSKKNKNKKNYEVEKNEVEDNDKSNSSLSSYQEKLDDAFQRLNSRLNTPLVNLIIAVIFLKIIGYIFGF